MQHETAQNPIHCIQIEFILIGRFKWHYIFFLFLEKLWKTDVKKKCKENRNLPFLLHSIMVKIITLF